MRVLIKWLLICALFTGSLSAGQRYIVRTTSLLNLNNDCLLLGCTVVQAVEDPLSQLFVIVFPDGPVADVLASVLSGLLGILGVEPDRVMTVLDSSPPIPDALYDSAPVPYYGTSVRHGYIAQPAVQILRIREAQATYGIAGAGIVAVIDTGVDPNHSVLQNVLLPGYDFTRNRDGATETCDVNQSTAAVVDGAYPTYVNGTTAAVVSQSTAAVVDNPEYAAFGHGTMVAGVIHLVAPQVMILPAKAFAANGRGYTSDILRAIYWAVRRQTRVINMSFSMPSSSAEFKRAIDYATGLGIVSVAAAGNDGQATTVYPAAFNNVMGVASTTNSDVRSTFSNYGQNLVWVAAPGEGVVTTYPFSTYAAAWGTSFSAPFVSGTVALLLDLRSGLDYGAASDAVAHAKPLTPALGHGRLDIVQAAQAVQGMQ